MGRKASIRHLVENISGESNLVMYNPPSKSCVGSRVQAGHTGVPSLKEGGEHYQSRQQLVSGKRNMMEMAGEALDSTFLWEKVEFLVSNRIMERFVLEGT